jgi:hypothetical protein
LSSHSTPALGRWGDISVVALLSLFQFAFAFGLPWFDNGLWPQTEGPMAALNGLTAFLLLALGTQITLRDPRYLAALKSPVVVALFGFALFSLVAAPFTESPARSLHGTMKHGVGALWHLQLALVTLAAVAVWQDRKLRAVVVWSSVAAAFAVLSTYSLDQAGLGIGTPLAFAEWAGLLALAAAGTLVVSKSGPAMLRWPTAVFLVAYGYEVSDNRAVILALVAVALFAGLRYVPVAGKLVSSGRLRAAAVVSVFIAGTAAMYLAAPIIETRALAGKPVDQTGYVLSDAPLDRYALHDGAIGTIWSRSYMVRILVDDMIETPSRLLFGHGFGHFGTAYEMHARDVPGRRYPDANPYSSATYWDVHDKANFHSHNMLAETVTSTGLVGGVLWLTVFAILAHGSRRGALIALAIAVTGTFWFPINHMVGGLGLLFASTARPRSASDRHAAFLSGTGSVMAIFGTLVFGYIAFATAVLGMVERSERGFMPLEINRNTETCGFVKTRLFPESEVVIDLYSVLQNRIKGAADPVLEMKNRTTNLVAITCMLRRYYENDGDLRALVASLEARAGLVSRGPVSYGPMVTDIQNWGDDIARLLSMSPERTEYLPPYISILAGRAPHKALPEIERFLALTKPVDPVHEYLLSVQSRMNGDEEGYKAHYRKAVDLGYANLWIVSTKAAAETGAK